MAEVAVCIIYLYPYILVLSEFVGRVFVIKYAGRVLVFFVDSVVFLHERHTIVAGEEGFVVPGARDLVEAGGVHPLVGLAVSEPGTFQDVSFVIILCKLVRITE